MQKINYSETIAHAIQSFLKEDDWHFAFDEEKGVFRFGLSIRSKLKNINYIVDVRDNEYVVYAIAPVWADEKDKKMMANMAEFECRVNYGLVRGNFELDMRDGEVRFKYFVSCDGITPSQDMVRHSIHYPAVLFKSFGAGIIDIIYGGVSAKEAVERCEKAMADVICSGLSEVAEEHESTDTDCVPTTLKTELFGAEGDDE